MPGARRQKRACTLSPPYGVCITCMDAWSACAPLTSHYSATNDPAGLRIREACEAKKPTQFAEAQAADTPVDGFIVNTTVEATATPAGRRMLRV